LSSIINWMGGWPKEGLLSGADWEERVTQASERGQDTYSQGKLREQLAHGILKSKTGEHAHHVMLTHGADDALTWILDNKLAQGDTVLTEKLTSRSALLAFRKAGMQVEAVEGDRFGMDPEALTTALYRHRPKMVYVSPSCTDPEGVGWNVENKQAIQHRCMEAGVLLVTDDRHELLLYDSDDLQRANKRIEPGMLSIGQIPPGLIAGLRMGWIVGSAEWLMTKQREVPVRLRTEMLLSEYALSQLVEEQPLEPLIEMLRMQCEERMKRMTDYLTKSQVVDLCWVKPRGGLHLWVTLPAALDGEALLRGAWLKGLIFQPGAPFYVREPKINTIRITHAFADEREMRLGVSRLVESMDEFMGRWSKSE
jgi:2-aminoadipate transaminase